ncbi:hypothetical protein C0Q70_12182 [Pomacea canaliculata]|uniref:Ig-like domain-containing protein n=1 Tax=Pomacea canaliculata TaxID=400727 RepID=A0A2T7P0T3_POMCA|nr:hypothetical protein C0Q70_12182 [Pomacea canaliculata]
MSADSATTGVCKRVDLTDTNLDTVTMVTTPSKEPVAGTEVKESGSCQLHTTLPQHSGSYGYYVNITPGGQSHVAKYSQHYSEWFIVGKPHPLSSDNVIKVRNMHFDLMAYPMPHIMTILPLAGDADTSVHPVESVISCTADTHLPYKFTCNFTEKAPGYYHVVVTNYFGDGNFTLEVEDDDDTTDPNIHNKSESTTVLVAGVVAFVLLVIVIAIVIVVVKGKKSGKGQIPLRREEYEEPLDLGTTASVNFLGKRQIPLPKEEYEPAWDLGKRQIPLRKEEYEPAWDLGPLKINRLCANDNSEHLQQENYYEEIDDGVVVADKKKETQKDNKDKLDKDKVPLTGVERETSATEQVVNTTHHELAEDRFPAVAEDTERWTNQDGLIYTSVDLNSSLSRKRPSPRLQQTEYVEVTFKNDNSNQLSPLLVNAANNKNRDVSIVSGTLVCETGDTGCGLNYVYPAEGVSCTTVTSSWNVTVTCNISSAYSSRGIYKCQLIRAEQGLTDTNLDTVTMVTTSTNEPVAKTEVKVSGSCQLHTTLPLHSGNYSYYVNIDPGGQSHVAKYSQHYSEWFIVGKPRPMSPGNVIKVRNMQFDLTAYPKPHTLRILNRTGDVGTSVHPVVSVIPCTADPHLPYKFTCNFTEKAPGYYHVVVTNYFGDGNFTLDVDDNVLTAGRRPSNPRENNSNQQSPLLVNAENNTKINSDVSIVNGTLLCGTGDTRCGLNYVYPADGVSCTTVTSSLNVTVTCNISSAYSSRGIYKCQLIRRRQGVPNKTLDRVTMVTTSNNESVAKTEVKVSGSCQLHTTLPPHNGSYGYYVNIAPGGQSHVAKYSELNSEWFTVELPSLPKMVCHPAPYVLENTNISCTCNTTSLGKPAGYLTWVTGKYPHTDSNKPVGGNRSDDKPTELHYSQTLTLADHSTTWFRCDVTWGLEQHRGENYTVNVGYKPRQLKLFFNKLSENVTVSEGDSVDVNCSADGRPAPEVTLINTVNNTKMATGSSVILSNFSARCEDSGEYTCSSQDYFSSQSPLTTSLRLQVNCKPRSLSPGNVTKVRNMHFDLVAYPMPRNMTILPRTGDAGTSVHPVVSCTADPYLPYKFTCNFTEKTPGYYPVVVTNDFGDGNFTLEVDDSEDTVDSDISNKTERTTALVGGVAALGVVVLAIVFAIIIVAVRSKKSGKRQVLPRREEYETPWDLVPLSINVPDVDDDREHLQPPRCCADIGAGVVADKEKQTQDDNKESTAPEEMYANIGSAASDDKAKTQKQKLEGNEIPEKKYPRKPRDLNKDKDKLDKDHVPLTGIERETSATEQVVNTTHHELAEYINTSSAAAAVAADTGRWTNQDGLIYTSADLNSSLSRKRPSPRLQQTEYVEVTFKNGKPHVCD